MFNKHNFLTPKQISYTGNVKPNGVLVATLKLNQWLQCPEGGAWHKHPEGGAWYKHTEGGAWHEHTEGGAWHEHPEGGALYKHPEGGAWHKHPEGDVYVTDWMPFSKKNTYPTI